MTRSLTSRPSSHFKLIFLSTGERTLHDVIQAAGKQSKGGQEARLIDIPADAGRGMGIFEEIQDFPSPAAMAQELARASKTNYGAAIDPFIKHVAENRDGAAERVRRAREHFITRHSPRDASGEVHRVVSLFGLIAAAGEIASELGLTGWKDGEATTAARACMESWIVNRGGTGAADVYCGIEALRSFIETHGSSRFQDIACPDAVIRDRAGFKERDQDGWAYYVFPNTFRSEICRGNDARAIARELIRRGHMQAQEDGTGRMTVKKRVPGGPTWFFAVLPSFTSEESD
jgi:uncharacterized protein (DUF927 family)